MDDNLDEAYESLTKTEIELNNLDQQQENKEAILEIYKQLDSLFTHIQEILKEIIIINRQKKLNMEIRNENDKIFKNKVKKVKIVFDFFANSLLYSFLAYAIFIFLYGLMINGLLVYFFFIAFIFYFINSLINIYL